MSKRKKYLSLVLFVSLLISQFMLGEHIYAEDSGKESGYNLSFDMSRNEITDYEDVTAVYSNYWMTQPKNNVFDKSNWDLNDFSVEYEVHVEGKDNTIVRNMTYTKANRKWNGNITFDNIKIPCDKVEIEYYNKDESKSIEPYLLHYDLYLKKSGDKMILNVPKIGIRKNYENPTGDEKVLEIKNINIQENNKKENFLYLNGQTGDDTSDGLTPEKALKTFGKAKEMAVANKNIKEIIVVGSTKIDGDISLDGTNANIMRGKDFSGYLFVVDNEKTVNLSNIVIDGNLDNKNIEKSLIEVRKNSILNIGEGAVLKNNKIKDIENVPTSGGAIKAYDSTVKMTGGIIENNQATYGGGVFLSKAVMEFSGGIIQKNRSNLVKDNEVSPVQYYSAGGGILAEEGSVINMTGNAKIADNYAHEIGGGISLGSNQWGETSTLNMNGGTIDKNTAGAAGGGIFIQAKYFTGGPSKAYIYGGKITNNKMDATGVTEKMFGGGGIYVNGANDNYGVNGDNGELYLKNVIITNNSSKLQGAGYASCPISKTKIYMTDGGAIYGNNSATKVNEIYILSNKYLGLHGGNPEYEISKRMLGGIPYNWKLQDGSVLEEKDHKGVLTKNNEYLALHTDEKGNELTSKLAKVIISGNHSETRGGGIGSNGTVTIGADEKTSVPVEKKWVDNDDREKSRPDSIKIKLIANDKYEIEARVLNKENNWKTVFSDLPVKNNGSEIKYSIAEEKISDYTDKITGNAKDGFVITNTYTPTKTSVNVRKVWEDNNDQDGIRPNKIKAQLYANGKAVGPAVEIKKSENWTYSWKDLPKKEKGEEIKYTVKEVGEVSGYVSEVNDDDISDIVIKNIHKPGTVSIKVRKIWEDNNDQDNKRPESITVKLLADGKEIKGKRITLNEANNWSGSFEEIDEYYNGKKIKYEVKEENSGEDYICKIKGNVEEGFTITNTKKDKNKKIPPKKTEKRLKHTKTDDNSSIAMHEMLLELVSITLLVYFIRIKTKKKEKF